LSLITSNANTAEDGSLEGWDQRCRDGLPQQSDEPTSSNAVRFQTHVSTLRTFFRPFPVLVATSILAE
jgi:hypothetical protein